LFGELLRQLSKSDHDLRSPRPARLARTTLRASSLPPVAPAVLAGSCFADPTSPFDSARYRNRSHTPPQPTPSFAALSRSSLARWLVRTAAHEMLAAVGQRAPFINSNGRERVVAPGDPRDPGKGRRGAWWNERARRAGVYIVAKEALSDRREDILLSDRQRAEGFLCRCGLLVPKFDF
jgi:hypothetical protein